MYLLPRFAHPCVCVRVQQLRSLPSIFPSLEKFENSNPRPFEMLCILDSKVEMEEIGEGQRTMRGKEEEEDSRGWWFFEIPISCYERCLELLLLAAPYVALLRTPHTGSSPGRTRNGRRMRVENRCYVTNRN